MLRGPAVTLLMVLAFTVEAMSAQSSGSDKLPGADGREVVGYLNQSEYHTWQPWPGKGAFYPGRFPHGSLLTTYVSKGAYQAVENKAGRIPPGQFIVKENFSSEKELIAINVMYKLAGYNAEGGDWFWLKYLPDGTIQAEGKVGGCIGCHAAVKNNDWLFIGPLK
jgi:hypothetical protein